MAQTTAKEPGQSARVLLAAAMLGMAYLDFFRYKAGGFDDPHAFDGRLQGLAPAPEQYRVGVYWLAHAITTHLRIAPSMALAVLDGAAALVAVLLLVGVLERSAVYRRSNHEAQWFGAAAFALLVLWFLGWLPWLQKPETLPTAAFTAGMLWLWEARPLSPPASRVRELGYGCALVALSMVLATFRADVACLLNAGVLLYVALGHGGLSLPRRKAMATAALGAAGAAAIQFWLMRVAYPAASYGRVKMWQLWPNLKHGSRWPPFVVFLLPLLWMLWQARRRGLPQDAAGRALLVGAALYAALWVTIGKIDEVRIFLPLALALTPFAVQLAMQRIEDER